MGYDLVLFSNDELSVIRFFLIERKVFLFLSILNRRETEVNKPGYKINKIRVVSTVCLYHA